MLESAQVNRLQLDPVGRGAMARGAVRLWLRRNSMLRESIDGKLPANFSLVFILYSTGYASLYPTLNFSAPAFSEECL